MAEERVSVLDFRKEAIIRYKSQPPSERTYEKVRADVEDRVIKVSVLGPRSLTVRYIIKKNRSKGFQVVSRSQASGVLRAVRYWEQDSNGGWKEKFFARRWFKDPGAQRMRRMAFDPSGTKEGIYNTFEGFQAEKLPAVADDEVEGLCAVVNAHILDVVSDGNREDAGLLHDWMAHIFQRPGVPLNVAPLLYGTASDCGHELLAKWFCDRLLGLDCTRFVARTPADLRDTVLVNLCMTRPVKGWMKAHIHDTPEQRCSNLLFTTCSKPVCDEVMKSWRFGIYRCSDAVRGNEAYFSRLHAQLDDPRVCRAFYQALMARDLSRYSHHFSLSWALRTPSRSVSL